MRNSNSKSLRKKLEEYPRILGGAPLPETGSEAIGFIVANAKPLRDALVPPGPFRLSPKFGGHDKLDLFYSTDARIAVETAWYAAEAIKAIHCHVTPEPGPDLVGLGDLRHVLDRLKHLGARS